MRQETQEAFVRKRVQFTILLVYRSSCNLKLVTLTQRIFYIVFRKELETCPSTHTKTKRDVNVKSFLINLLPIENEL